MKYMRLLGICTLLLPAPALAQQVDDNPPPTVRVPLCLQYPKSKNYVPCTGVVPVDPVSGNPSSWDNVAKGSPSKPAYSVPVVNSLPVNSTNPLPVVCTNCTGGTGASNATTPGDTIRRAFWSETSNPLSASASYTGQIRDNSGLITGSPTKWNSFACFAYSDQATSVSMQASNDGTVWFPVQTKNITSSGGSVYLSQPMFTKYWRCQATNGPAAQTTLVLNSAFGM